MSKRDDKTPWSFRIRAIGPFIGAALLRLLRLGGYFCLGFLRLGQPDGKKIPSRVKRKRAG